MTTDKDQAARAGDGITLSTRDEDDQWTLDRAADLLKGYADHVRSVGGNELQYWPYLPEIEFVIEGLREIAAAPVMPCPPQYATEINRLRNVIQAACSGGLGHMIERWKVLFPDAPVPTVKAAEPVAWRWEHYAPSGEVFNSGISETCVQPTRHAYIHEASGDWVGTRVTPLYAAPAAAPAVPLNMDQAYDAVKEAGLDWHAGWTVDPLEVNRYLQLIRIIERAHGIQAPATAPAEGRQP